MKGGVMGFLSGLFGNSRSKSESFIVQWGEKKRKEAKYIKANNITPENMFDGFIYGVGSFARTIFMEETKQSKDVSELFSKKIFANDSALFEVGCYCYFQVDLWLFKNNPNLRERISPFFMHNFIALFTQALNINNLDSIFVERVSKYGEMARSKADIDEYLLLLSQLIYQTKNNERPKSYDFNTPLQIPLELNFIPLQLDIRNWYVTILPAMIESIESSIKLLK